MMPETLSYIYIYVVYEWSSTSCFAVLYNLTPVLYSKSSLALTLQQALVLNGWMDLICDVSPVVVGGGGRLKLYMPFLIFYLNIYIPNVCLMVIGTCLAMAFNWLLADNLAQTFIALAVLLFYTIMNRSV